MVLIEYLKTDSLPELVIKNRDNLKIILGKTGLDQILVLLPKIKENEKRSGENSAAVLKSETGLKDLIQQLSHTTGNVAKQLTQINDIKSRLASLKTGNHYRGTYSAESDIVAITTPIEGDYALYGSGPYTEMIYSNGSWLVVKGAGGTAVTHPGVSVATFGGGLAVTSQKAPVTDSELEVLSKLKDLIDIVNGNTAPGVSGINPIYANATLDNVTVKIKNSLDALVGFLGFDGSTGDKTLLTEKKVLDLISVLATTVESLENRDVMNSTTHIVDFKSMDETGLGTDTDKVLATYKLVQKEATDTYNAALLAANTHADTKIVSSLSKTLTLHFDDGSTENIKVG